MQKNGFTLIEMVSAIAIMVILSAIAIFSITGIVRNSTTKLYNLQVTNIIDASRTYAVQNATVLSANNEITLCDLKRSSLLDYDLKNPKTEEQFDNSLIVRITKNSDGEFEFSFDGESKMENYHCDLDMTVAINGDSPMYVKLGSTHIEQGVLVKKKDLTCTRRVSGASSNDTNCYYDLTVSGDYQSAITDGKYSSLGTFKETYEIKDDMFSSTITRTIVVQDKTAPKIHVSYGGVTHNESFSVRLVEGESANFNCSATDNTSSNVSCKKIKDDYNGTTRPGSYEIVYSATDSANNTSTFLVTITVLAKNKNLVVGANVNTTEWTNGDVTLKIVPLYSNENCGGYLYSFDNFFFNSTDTETFTTNGNHKLGIKCKNTLTEDYMMYKITNIDKEAPTFEGGAKIRVSTLGTLSETTKEGIRYYYSNTSVSLVEPSGATDSISGIDHYEIYVNDQLYNSTTLDGDGKYKISIAAVDRASNRSEIETAAYVIISSLKPSCEFPRCTGNSCSTVALISGSYVTYGINGYALTTSNFDPPVVINYKFNCTYEYFEGEESIYVITNIARDKVYMRDEYGNLNRIDVNNITRNNSLASTTCNNGKCTKIVPYTASISSYGIYGVSYLYLKSEALCDRVGNCNQGERQSMPLWDH